MDKSKRAKEVGWVGFALRRDIKDRLYKFWRKMDSEGEYESVGAFIDSMIDYIEEHETEDKEVSLVTDV